MKPEMRPLILLALTIILLLGCEHSASTLSVETKERQCEAVHDQPNQYVLSQSDISFWNHASAPEFNSEELSFPGEYYEAKLEGIQDDGVCSDNHLGKLSITLVKKQIRNAQQHINGLEFSFRNRNITFGELESMALVTNVDFEQSSFGDLLDSNDENRNSGQYETALPLDSLIDDKVHFRLTLYGKYHPDLNKPTIYARYNFSFSNSDSKVWVRNIIEIGDFDYSSMQNYHHTRIIKESIKDELIVGAILTAETPSTKTLESLTSTEFVEGKRERYLENYLAISHISLIKQ